MKIFQYCPKCKNILIHEGERYIYCKKCNFCYYFGPAVTNTVILENKKNEILLVKRKTPPMAGYWDLPGGFIEYGETLEESIHREIAEELNISVKNIKYYCSSTDRYAFKDINYHTLGFIVTATMQSENVKPADDINGYKFFKKEEIPYDKIAFEGLKKAIKLYLNKSSE